MPLSSPRSTLLNRSALGLAAGACLVLAGGLLMPELVNCRFASEAPACAATRVPLSELGRRLQAVHGDTASLSQFIEDMPLFKLSWPIP